MSHFFHFDRAFLEHLAFWHNKTDGECVALATNDGGVDVEQALMNILERDFCTSINNNAVEMLRKQTDEKDEPTR
jgi:hypothetical protein